MSFVCPKCGGTYFGSSQQADGSMVRHCHGDAYSSGCGFSFPVAEDAKYFTDTAAETVAPGGDRLRVSVDDGKYTIIQNEVGHVRVLRYGEEWREGDKLILALAHEVEKLQAFKDFVHKRLDDAGIPVDPPSVHRDHGCRIGGRLDLVLGATPACAPTAKRPA